MENPWKVTKHFCNDKIEWPENTNPDITLVMDQLREEFKSPIRIHRCYDPSATLATSRHRMTYCDAVDFDVEPTMQYKTLLKAFILLTRHPKIRGIGIYPYWNRPGFHVDLRPEVMKSYWLRDRDGLYLPVSDKSIKEHLLKGD